MDKLEALLRGAGQGASAGWGEEGAAKLLDFLPTEDDGTGIPRTYAAGSREQDYKNKFRADDSAASTKYPGTFTTGAVAGALPAALASLGLGGGAGAAGLARTAGMGALQGAVGGAGAADDGQKLTGALEGGAVGGALGAAGHGLPAAMAELRAAAQPGLTPALATAGAGAGMRAAPRGPAAEPGGPQINRMLPPRGPIEETNVQIPRPGRTVRESQLPQMDDVADKYDNLTSAANRRLVDRSMAKEASRTSPLDPQMERWKDMIDGYEQRVADRAAPAPETARPTAMPTRPAAPETVRAPAPDLAKTARPPRRGAVADPRQLDIEELLKSRL